MGEEQNKSFGSENFLILAVDKLKTPGLYTHPSARCTAFRRDGAPLKLLTGTVKPYPTVLGCTGFDGSPGYRRVGSP